MAYFPEVADKVRFEGRESKNPLAFRHYDPEKVVGDTEAQNYVSRPYRAPWRLTT